MPNENAADRVYRRLEAAILSGRLKPREHIVERDLVAELNVSRTPIREALARLRAAGLVAGGGGRGVVVSDFTRQEIRDLYYLREALERAAAKLIVKRASAADVEDARSLNEAFRKACERDDLRAMIDANNAFHRRINEISGNRFLVEDLEHVRLKAFLVRHATWMESGAAMASADEHEEMLAALETRDRRAFERTVLKHMNVAKNAYLARRALG